MRNCYRVYYGYTRVSCALDSYRAALLWARDFINSGDMLAPISIRMEQTDQPLWTMVDVINWSKGND